ncbi:MAG: FHA domain-containing RING-CH finger protein, partial [archaeon]|nr:FHA domain-containing RING-CH finger protein [archaeon]
MNGNKKLFGLEIEDGKFNLIPNGYKCSDVEEKKENLSWFVFKSSKCPEKGKQYKLVKGDIIKVGRTIIRLRDIKSKTIKEEPMVGPSKSESFRTNSPGTSKNLGEGEVQPQSLNLNRDSGTDGIKIYSTQIQKKVITDATENKNSRNKKKHPKKKKNSDVCRICLENEIDEIDDPLIQPCKCSGSLKYIHLQCLRHWLNTHCCNKISGTDYCSIFAMKSVECEICKEKLPDCLIHNGRQLELFDFFAEFESYAVFENLNSIHPERNSSKQKIYFVVSIEEGMDLTMGRGHDAGFILSDISVSRNHCTLSFLNGNLYIEDNDSKFGTLLLIQAPKIKLNDGLPLNIQTGRTFFTLHSEKSCCFSCFFKKRNTLDYYTQSQNCIQIKGGGIEIAEERESDSGTVSEEEEDKLEINGSGGLMDQKKLDNNMPNLRIDESVEITETLRENFKNNDNLRLTVAFDGKGDEDQDKKSEVPMEIIPDCPEENIENPFISANGQGEKDNLVNDNNEDLVNIGQNNKSVDMQNGIPLETKIEKEKHKPNGLSEEINLNNEEKKEEGNLITIGEVNKKEENKEER